MLGLPELVLAALVTAATAVPLETWDDLQVSHAWDTIPKGWVLYGSAPEESTIDLRIGLKPHQENAIVDALYAVSDPESAQYGAHLSKSDIARLVAPHPDTRALVSAWLAHHDIPSHAITSSASGDWLHLASIPINTANSLLAADYQLYKHVDTNTILLRTVGYSLPAALHAHVAVVSPTTYFRPIRTMRSTAPDGVSFRVQRSAETMSSCNTVITPECLRQLYNSTDYVQRATDQNKLGIAGYSGQYASFADLQTFFERFQTDAKGQNFSVVLVNGGKNDQAVPGLEAGIDTQYAEALSFPMPNIYYSTGGSPPFIPDDATPANTNEPYLELAQFLLAQDAVPQTLSTSYGDDEQTVPPDYARSVCDLYAQLGARGTSIIFSSGDFGVGMGSCKVNDGSGRTEFIPIFPASCPFVTVVGGTTGISPEVAASFSSGGFSNLFPRPAYQYRAVSAFLEQLGDTYAGLFNASGRGFPDVAAQAQNFQVVLNGTTVNAFGTSCSAPVFSAIVALLNDYRLSQGKPSLGFLNPMLYLRGVAGLNDITSGTNPGCGTDGFTAIKGWDPVTGLGTPDFRKLQAIVG